MKLKKAHIFLAATLVAVTSLAGCGTNNSGELVSPGYNVNDLVNAVNLTSLVINPRVASAHAGQDVQLQVTGNFSNGSQSDVTQSVTYGSSDSTKASVSSSGVVTAKLPGTVTITATGAAGITDSIQFTVNPFINRLFVSDSTNNGILVFRTDETGTVSPLRSIQGSNTGLTNPQQMVISGQELFVADGIGGAVNVFYLQATGNVAPLRRLKSPSITTTLGVAVFNNELYVSSTNGSIAVFNATDSGDAVAAKRVITGANTLLALPGFLTISNNRVLTADTTNLAALGFGLLDTGNVAPTTNLRGTGGNLFLGPIGVEATATELFVSDRVGGAIHRFAVGANNNDAPLSTISGGTTGLTAPRGTLAVGNELYVTQNFNSTVSIFTKTQNGGASPIRTFSSASFAAPTGMVIGGSF